MASSAASSDSVVGPSSNHASEDETSQPIQLQYDGFDPYLDTLGSIEIEDETDVETEDGIEDEIEGEFEEEELYMGIKKPYVGLEFRTPKEAYDFYNSYAGQVGFSVRKSSQSKNRRGVSSMRYVCSKSGVPRSQKNMEMPFGSLTAEKTPKRKRVLTRVGCKASCRVKLGKNGLWQVSVFVEEHNHDLVKSPTKKRNLRSQKQRTLEDKETILNLNPSAQNVGSSQIQKHADDQHGGKQSVQLQKKDVNNAIAGENHKYLGVAVDATLLYFQKKQEEDPEFFYAVQPDENGYIKSIFWVDGRARRAYQEFGDVVTFDTTYLAKKNSMPLAPFIGVNHHQFSIFYGMALIICKDADSFMWLFKTWLVAMYGKHPKTIITNQYQAMKKVVELIFPNTLHRCCQWHIIRKARENFDPPLDDMKVFQEELCKVVNGSLTVPYFDRAWTAMVDRHGLRNNSYINEVYKTQAEWVPAYFRGMFFADTSTTQRRKSMDALFTLWVNNRKSIYQFVMQIDKMIESIWQRESDEDFKTMNEIPILWSHLKMEFEARQVYTRNVFSVFKEDVKDSLLGLVTELERDVRYEVTIDSHPFIRSWVPESYLVEVNKEESRVSCNCKGFEFEGLLCPHAIKVMHHVGILHLPDWYILKRWTKGANSNVKKSIVERSMELGESMELQTLRFISIKADLIKMGKLGAMNASAFSCLKEIISSGKEKLLTCLANSMDTALKQTKTTPNPMADANL